MHTIQQDSFFDSAPLADLQVRNIKSRLDEIREQYHLEAQKLQKNLRRSIESTLNAEQIAALKSILGEEYQLGSNLLEVLLVQYSKREARNFYSDLGEEFAFLADARSFTLEFDGELSSRRTAMPYEMIQKLIGICNQLGVQGIHSEELDELVETTNEKLSEYTMNLRARMIDGKIDREMAKEKIRLFSNELVDDIVDFVLDRLSEAEYQELEFALVSATIDIEGLVFALQHGSLGKRLKLSAHQKLKLGEIGEMHAEEIRLVLRKIESEILTKVKGELNDDQRQEFEKKFDAVIPDVLPNIPFLLLDDGNVHK